MVTLVGSASGIQRVEARGAVKPATVLRTGPAAQLRLAQQVSAAEVEKHSLIKCMGN